MTSVRMSRDWRRVKSPTSDVVQVKFDNGPERVFHESRVAAAVEVVTWFQVR